MRNCIHFIIVTVFMMLAVAAIPAIAAPPANDNFANPEILTGSRVSVARNNVEATKEAGEPNHAFNPGGRSVWFKWVAPMSRTMMFSTNRSVSNMDTLLHVYTGSQLNGLFSETFGNNINSPLNLRSFARLRVIQGVTYYIAVDGADNGQGPAVGSFVLDIQPSFNYEGADYDNDGRTDFAVFRPSSGSWIWFDRTTGNTIFSQWGLNGDIPVVSSTAGSGENERNVFRPTDGVWYQHTCCQQNFIQWGKSGDVPVPESYGGNAGTDFAVFRPSEGKWYIRYADNLYMYYQFGLNGDIPVAGHYSPDSFADVAVFRPSNGTWYFMIRTSSNGTNDQFSATQFGVNGDKPAPGDYDGDGLIDIAVYRPSTGVWWIRRSSDQQVTAFTFGIAEDIPVTGDYDGDGQFDYAVYRPSTGVWYIFQSTDGAVVSKQFGQAGDIPVTSNYGK